MNGVVLDTWDHVDWCSESGSCDKIDMSTRTWILIYVSGWYESEYDDKSDCDGNVDVSGPKSLSLYKLTTMVQSGTKLVCV